MSFRFEVEIKPDGSWYCHIAGCKFAAGSMYVLIAAAAAAAFALLTHGDGFVQNATGSAKGKLDIPPSEMTDVLRAYPELATTLSTVVEEPA